MSTPPHDYISFEELLEEDTIVDENTCKYCETHSLLYRSRSSIMPNHYICGCEII